jgi:hypothetical protein
MTYSVKRIEGEVKSLVHEEIKWVFPEELNENEFLMADVPIVRELKKLKDSIKSNKIDRD